ncbi:hypothetical protein [Curtobacterium phage Parvaparticeps]|nr:hypothetical protein [Curtobacterium phage Parvaparticeps]
MATLPEDILYGQVVAAYVLAVGNQEGDRKPDAVYPTGTITFTPTSTRVVSTLTDPVISVAPQKVTAVLVDGVLTDDLGNDSVTLVVGQYNVSFNIQGTSIPGFPIFVLSEGRIDLGLSQPLIPAPNEKFVVNEQVYLDTLAARDEVIDLTKTKFLGQAYDLDLLEGNVIANGQSLVNGPYATGEWFFIRQTVYSNDPYGWRTQTAVGFTGDATNREFRRTREESRAPKWTPWVEITSGGGSGGGLEAPVTYADLETALQAAYAQAINSVQRGTESIVYADIHPDIRAAINNGAAAYTALPTKADLVGGVVPTSQIPALAINDTFVVASQAAMLALTAQRGDIAKRTDLNGRSFVLGADAPGTLANWVDLGTTVDVSSVNGQSNVVVLGAADVGAVALTAAANSQVYSKNSAGIVTGIGYGTAATGGAIPVRDSNGQLVGPTPTTDIHLANKAYVDSKAGTVTPATKSAAYTLGGTSAFNNYNTQTLIARVLLDLPKKAKRVRVHIRNVVELSDFPQPNGPSVNGAWLGRKNNASGANPAAQTVSQAFPAGSGTLDGGAEWVSGWLTPSWDTGVDTGFLTYSVNMVNTNVAFNTVANAWYSANGTAGGDLTGAPANWVQYGDCPLSIYLEYEYDDDGSKVVLFPGDSITEGYYGGPWQQTSGPMRNWIGHIDCFPAAWGRNTGHVPIVNAHASAKATDWGTTSTKWTRFAGMATPFAPDAIVIHIGANDFFNGASAAAVATNVEAVARTARSKYPNAKIFLVGMIPLLSSNTAVTSANRIAMNSLLASLPKWVSDGYLEPKSLLDPSAGATAEYARPKYVSADGLHFTPEAYAALAREIAVY